MIVRPDQADTKSEGGITTLHLSNAGGLRQFGAYVEVMEPGRFSSDRHWHSNEDEFLYVLDGQVTLIDDEGEHDLAPDDAVCWPHGDPNAHRLTNRGAAPCRYVIMGSRVACDVCSYPDLGRQLINTETQWQVVDTQGKRLRGGDLPPDLLNLAPVWGTPFDASTPRERLLPAASREWVEEGPYTHPAMAATLGPYRHSVLGDRGGLSQFGVHLEELPPGSASSFRHWHEAEDEMVLVLSGHPTLIEDAETLMNPGEAACWPAGLATGHCLENRTDRPALYLTFGTRLPRDRIHYPDHDLMTEKDGQARRYTHADGRPRTKGDPL